MFYMYPYVSILKLKKKKKKQRKNSQNIQDKSPKGEGGKWDQAFSLVMFCFLGWVVGTWVLILLFLIKKHIYVLYPPLPIW